MLLGSHHCPRLHLVKPLETTVALVFLADAQKQNVCFISVFMYPGIFRRILLDEDFKLLGIIEESSVTKPCESTGYR